MNKELENVLKAFNEVEEFIIDMPLSYKGYNNLGQSQYISDKLNEVEEALNEYVKLKKALTPPIKKYDEATLLELVKRLEYHKCMTPEVDRVVMEMLKEKEE